MEGAQQARHPRERAREIRGQASVWPWAPPQVVTQPGDRSLLGLGVEGPGRAGRRGQHGSGGGPGARPRLPSPTMQARGGHSGPPPHAVVLGPGLDQHGHVDPVASSTYSSPLDPGAPISPHPVGVWLGNSQPLSGSGGMQGGRWGLIPVPVAPARPPVPPAHWAPPPPLHLFRVRQAFSGLTDGRSGFPCQWAGRCLVSWLTSPQPHWGGCAGVNTGPFLPRLRGLAVAMAPCVAFRATANPFSGAFILAVPPPGWSPVTQPCPTRLVSPPGSEEAVNPAPCPGPLSLALSPSPQPPPPPGTPVAGREPLPSGQLLSCGGGGPVLGLSVHPRTRGPRPLSFSAP